MMQFLVTGGPFVWLILLLAAVAVSFASRYLGSAQRRHATAALGTAACAAIVSLLSLALSACFLVGVLLTIRAYRGGQQRPAKVLGTDADQMAV